MYDFDLDLEPAVVYTCDECGDTICEGEVYYSVGDKKYCEYCMRAMMHIAELEDPIDEDILRGEDR